MIICHFQDHFLEIAHIFTHVFREKKNLDYYLIQMQLFIMMTKNYFHMCNKLNVFLFDLCSLYDDTFYSLAYNPS